MRPSKAAIQTARTLIGEYYTAGEPSPAAMTQILQAVYDAQFGNETLYRINIADETHMNEYAHAAIEAGVLVPVEGDER